MVKIGVPAYTVPGSLSAYPYLLVSIIAFIDKPYHVGCQAVNITCVLVLG